MDGEHDFTPLEEKDLKLATHPPEIVESGYESEIVEVGRMVEEVLRETIDFIAQGAGTDEEKRIRTSLVLGMSRNMVAGAKRGLENFRHDEGTPEQKAQFINMILQLGNSALSRGGEMIDKFRKSPGSKEDKGAQLYELLMMAQGAMDTLSRMRPESVEKMIRRLRRIMAIVKPFLPKR